MTVNGVVKAEREKSVVKSHSHDLGAFALALGVETTVSRHQDRMQFDTMQTVPKISVERRESAGYEEGVSDTLINAAYSSASKVETDLFVLSSEDLDKLCAVILNAFHEQFSNGFWARTARERKEDLYVSNRIISSIVSEIAELNILKSPVDIHELATFRAVVDVVIKLATEYYSPDKEKK